MAANIDQIFQEFILNKIREIEVQNEDKTYVTTVSLRWYFCFRMWITLIQRRVSNAEELIVHLCRWC